VYLRQPGGAAQCGDAPARLHRVARRAGVSGEQRYGAVQVRRDQRDNCEERELREIKRRTFNAERPTPNCTLLTR